LFTGGAVRALPRAGADLLLLRPRQHLLRARLRSQVPTRGAARSGPTLPIKSSGSPQTRRARPCIVEFIGDLREAIFAHYGEQLSDAYREQQQPDIGGPSKVRSAQSNRHCINVWLDHWQEASVQALADIDRQEAFHKYMSGRGFSPAGIMRVLNVGKAALNRT
jgi:hypothetical protein